MSHINALNRSQEFPFSQFSYAKKMIRQQHNINETTLHSVV